MNSDAESGEQKLAGLDPGSAGRGWILGGASYVLWVFFPLYFNLLSGTDALEVIVHRAFWGLLTCLLLLAVTKNIKQLRALIANKSVLKRLAVAGLLIVTNWSCYVYAVTNQHVVDAAFGYFINPLVTAALSVVVLRERLTRAQWVAVALGAACVVYFFFALHVVPWLSLGMAFSFALYSLMKKTVAAQVPPLAGMAIETSAALPFLLIYQVILLVQGRSTFQELAATGQPVGAQLALLIGGGIITVIPLLLFAAAARMVPLGALGLMQYVNPVGQLLVGVYLLGEPMQPERWIATAIVCLALVALSFDAVRAVFRREGCKWTPGRVRVDTGTECTCPLLEGLTG